MQTPTRGPQDQIPAAPSAPRPARREQDLIVVPEAAQPTRWGWIAAIVAGVVALAVIIALVLWGIDQRERADALDDDLAAALVEQDALIDAATASRERIVALETRVLSLGGDLQRARRGRDVAAASRQEARESLRQARQAVEDEQVRFRAFMGPVIADGTHVGRLIAVGADQSPARITIDLGRWFTGRAATGAAIEDGVIVSGENRPNYLRNDDVVWRTLPVDPFASVTVLGVGGNRFTIGLGELQRLMRADTRRAERVTNDPFRITVVDGRITTLRQLSYP